MLKALLSGIGICLLVQVKCLNLCSSLFQKTSKWTNNGCNFTIMSLHSILVYWLCHLFTSLFLLIICFSLHLFLHWAFLSLLFLFSTLSSLSPNPLSIVLFFSHNILPLFLPTHLFQVLTSKPEFQIKQLCWQMTSDLKQRDNNVAY